MANWMEFRQCPGCGYDFATGEGEKGCSYYECPYVPEELRAFCSTCMYDFVTGEGNPPCADPETCEQGADARGKIANVRRWKAQFETATA